MSLMDPRIHQVLDGELPREALPPGLRPALDRLQAAAALLRLGPTGRSVAARVMAEIRRPFPGLLTRLVRWVTERHAITVSLRPVWSLVVAAVVVGVVALIPSRGSEGPSLSAEEGVAQFVGRFPGARSVVVVVLEGDDTGAPVGERADDLDGPRAGETPHELGDALLSREGRPLAAARGDQRHHPHHHRGDHQAPHRAQAHAWF